MKLGNSGYGYSSIVVITTLRPHCHSAVWCAPAIALSPPGTASRGVQRSEHSDNVISKELYKCEKNHFERAFKSNSKPRSSFSSWFLCLKHSLALFVPLPSLSSQRDCKLFSRLNTYCRRYCAITRHSRLTRVNCLTRKQSWKQCQVSSVSVVILFGRQIERRAENPLGIFLIKYAKCEINAARWSSFEIWGKMGALQQEDMDYRSRRVGPRLKD